MATVTSWPALRRALLVPSMLLPAAALAAAAPLVKTGELRFALKTPTVRQELKLLRTSEKTASFDLTIDGECRRTVAGQARLRGGPPVIQKDEKGRSYPAEEFVYLSAGCGLFLRIEAKQGRRATVAQVGACPHTCGPWPDIMARAEGGAGTPARRK
jgi:hypothetical protein